MFHALANHISLDLAAGASSGFASAGTFHCRRVNGPELCTERYGSATGGEVARAVFTLGMIGLSEYGRKHKFREWFVPAAGTAAFNTYWGVREWRTHENKTEALSLRR